MTGAVSVLAALASIQAEGQTWTEAASMNVTREYPGLARLPDGRILAVTGHPLNGHSLASAEIYDPKSDAWTPTGSLNLARNGVEPGGLIVLKDGKVLVAGGGTGSRSAHEAELYDPSMGTWTETGSMNQARANHSATLLKDGRVLVTGGINWGPDTVLASTELYEPDSRTWSAAGYLATPRTNHCDVLLDDGRVLIMGGTSESDLSGGLHTAEIFDPASGEFRATAPMNQARRAFRALLLRDGRVIVIGGAAGRTRDPAGQLDSVEIFDPHAETWTDAPPMFEGRWGPTATLLRNGRILVTGGMHGRIGRRPSAEIFDPAANVWSSAGALRQARNGHRDITLDDGRILIVGGFSGRDYLSSCEIFQESP